MHMSRFIKKALYFAAEKHDGQYRKGSRVPYIAHPVQVAFGVRAYTDDEGIIAAALLHDTLEDCPDVSVALLEKEFSDRVARIVNEISFIGDEKHVTWKEKKEAYLTKIKKASKEALVIVAVDKMCNFKAYFDALRKRDGVVARYFGGTPEQYRWYYTSIGNILTLALGEHPAAKDYTAAWQKYNKENP